MDVYEKSLNILKKIIDAQRKGFNIILVGGWAVYFYNPYMKSKDIDLIIPEKDFWKLADFLKSIGFSETAGEHLEKKGFSMLYNTDKIEVDVYTKKIGGFNVSKIDAEEVRIDGKKLKIISLTDLVMLKINTAAERLGSAKGSKDLSDLLALIEKNYKKIDFKKIKKEIREKKVKDILMILLKDYKQAQKIYPLSLKDYKKIKKFLL